MGRKRVASVTDRLGAAGWGFQQWSDGARDRDRHTGGVRARDGFPDVVERQPVASVSDRLGATWGRLQDSTPDAVAFATRLRCDNTLRDQERPAEGDWSSARLTSPARTQIEDGRSA